MEAPEVEANRVNTLSMPKDMSDIVRAKILIFIPFFGAFLGFAFSKNDYLANSTLLMKIWCLAVFGLGAWYARTVSQFLWTLERLRMCLNCMRT